MAMIPRAVNTGGTGGTGDSCGGACGPDKICIDVNQNVSGSGGGGAGNGGGTMDHEQLTNRLGAGTDGEAWHFSRGEREQILARLTNRPGQPLNLSPEHEEKNVYQYPRFVGSKYHHPNNVPMAGVNIRVATDASFANVVLESAVMTSQPSFLLPAFDTVVTPITTYYWSIQYVDDEGNVGEWSRATSFTTGLEFLDTVVLQPQMTIPTDGAKIASANPILATTPFLVAGTSDTHVSSDWQIAGTSVFDGDHVLYESLDDRDNLTAIIAPVNLSGGTDFYARARHKAENTLEKSPWSPVRHFSLRPYYDDWTVGVAFRKIGNGLVARHIDLCGNEVVLPAGYFDSHPLYLFQEITIADQSMLMVPEIYVRCEAGVDGDDYRYWISPQAFKGSYLHPAFALSDGAIYWGKYLAGSETANVRAMTDVNSRSDYYPALMPTSAASYLLHAEWLNTGEDAAHRGWHVESIYDHMLRFLLMIVELKSFVLGTRFNGQVNTSVLNGSAGLSMWRNNAHPFINTSLPSVNNFGKAIQGFYQVTDGDPLQFQIAHPSALELRIPVSSRSAWNDVSTYSASVGGFVTGYSEDLALDLDLLFLPGTQGTTTGVSVIAGTYTNSVRKNNMVTRAGAYYVNSLPACRCIYIYGDSNAVCARIAKWTQ